MKKSIVLLSLCGIIISCQYESAENHSIQNEIVFYAQTEQPTSKTSVDNDGKIYWLSGDAIKIFNGNLSAKLVSTNDVPSSSATFKGNAEGIFTGVWTYAIYPYSEEATYSGGNAIYPVELPSEQTAVAGSFADDLFISVAMSDNQSLQFYNVCGGICFTVVQENITSVIIRGGGNLAGRSSVVFDNGIPSITTYENTYEVTLSAPEGESFIPGERYYAVCYPEKWNNGYSLLFTKKDGTQALKQNTNPVEIKRATFGLLENVDEGLVFTDIQTQQEKERNALIALYKAGNGAEWSIWENSNWCTSGPVSEWGGVNVNDLGLVTSLRISDYNGYIPKEIGDFAALEDLRIYGKFSGQLPSQITNLRSARVIHIQQYGNYLLSSGITGSIEFDWSPMQRLEELRITHQQISGGIPESLGELKNLVALYLNWNMLSGTIPSALCGLTKLKELDLSTNILSGTLPEQIGQMQSLEYLSLLGNGDAEERNRLPEYTNSFSGGFPASMASLSNLAILILAENQISGEIPDFIWSLPNLRVFNVFLNHITGQLSSAIGNASKLVELNLCSNEMSGTLPEELWNLYNLSALDLGSYFSAYGRVLEEKNHFTGELSPKVSNLSNLTSLSIANCDFYGEIPTSITSLVNLGSLKINNNNFTGTIPDGIKDMTNLHTFWCQGNKLSGYLSDSFMDVLNARNHYSSMEWIVDPQQEGYEFEYGLYESSDYSRHKQVKKLQAATRGNGIDIVLMGDGFVDTDIQNGTYDKVMELMCESLFMYEPFTSHRDLFNVYAITLVSKNKSAEYGETALEIEPIVGYGYLTGRSIPTVDELIPGLDHRYLTVSVATTAAPAGSLKGVCWFDASGNPLSYGEGLGLAVSHYDGVDEASFKGTVCHETCGHGFGKLEDEYYRRADSADEFYKSSVTTYHEYGWWANIDITSSPEEVLWKSYLTMPYYINEGIGIFEGGGGDYTYGVWRPSQDSIMRSSGYGGFNAPSREAIYRRIHKIAFGVTPTFEEFVEWDMQHPQQASQSPRLHSPQKGKGRDGETNWGHDCFVSLPE